MTTPPPAEVDYSPSSPQGAPSTVAVNMDSDYGTPNCLFLYYLPLVHESKKEDLMVLQKEIHAWHAYELGRAEELVRRRINEKSLSNDDSPDARVKRTNYRAKVLQNLRECREMWAPVLDRQHTRSRMKVRRADLNTAIRQEILGHCVRSDSAEAQFSVILKMIDFIVASNPHCADHKYWFTHTHFAYDSEDETFRSHFNTMSFRFVIEDPAQKKQEIKCQEEPIQQGEPIEKTQGLKDQDQEDPIPQKEQGEKGKDQEEEEEEEDLISLRFETSRYPTHFYRDSWEKIRPKLESKPHYFEEGEKIRKEMSVEFVVNE